MSIHDFARTIKDYTTRDIWKLFQTRLTAPTILAQFSNITRSEILNCTPNDHIIAYILINIQYLT